MSSKIFVANFPFSTSAEELTDLFGQYGTVIDAKVATDRETGRSRGFGFIEMGSPTEALTAIEALNGQDLGGRPLAVRVAEERREQAPAGARGPRGGFGAPRGGFGGPRGGYGGRGPR